MIAGIESGKQAVQMFRVARILVKVNEGVEVAGSADPLVNGLPVRLSGRSRMVELRTDKRENGAAYYLDAVGMSARDNLLVSGD